MRRMRKAWGYRSVLAGLVVGLTMTGGSVMAADEATPAAGQAAGQGGAVSEMGGMKTGSADVKVDGSTYTITGQAAGADMKIPMAGMISKNFEIKVSCG